MTARRRRARSPRPWHIALLLTGAALLVWAIWLAVRPAGTARTNRKGEFGDTIRSVARRVGASGVTADESIRKVHGVFVRRWRVRFADCGQARRFAEALEDRAAGWGGTVRTAPGGGCKVGRVRVDLGEEAFDIRLTGGSAAGKRPPHPSPTPAPTATPTLPPNRRGRLAILLDDAGQSLDLVPRLEALPREIAVSVLPFLPASSETAVRLHQAGHEVWLHLPMEPDGYPGRNPGPGAVLTSMPEAEIRSTVRAAINNVPFIVGVNNHEGSKATANLRVMTWVMQELAPRGLAFIDSRTTKYTVAEDAARAQGIPTGRRNVFLDNVRTPAAIRRQLDRAVYLARRDGAAIAIGHCKAVTVSVLEREAPRLWKRKVDLVPPSKLVH